MVVGLLPAVTLPAYAAGDVTLSVDNDTSALVDLVLVGSELLSGEAGSANASPGIEVYFRDKDTQPDKNQYNGFRKRDGKLLCRIWILSCPIE